MDEVKKIIKVGESISEKAFWRHLKIIDLECAFSECPECLAAIALANARKSYKNKDINTIKSKLKEWQRRIAKYRPPLERIGKDMYCDPKDGADHIACTSPDGEYEDNDTNNATIQEQFSDEDD